ncbi:hypothetical protein CRG98_001148 [Punica granatum]|uniref:Uncharacterized protein n=1 Tax=Punica granatum TaxID=22663 RepID=A0A2I0LCU6_PUNGR|nr:hypothetical protein CRG98_001148 [Punica granatum]
MNELDLQEWSGWRFGTMHKSAATQVRGKGPGSVVGWNWQMEASSTETNPENGLGRLKAWGRRISQIKWLARWVELALDGLELKKQNENLVGLSLMKSAKLREATVQLNWPDSVGPTQLKGG